MWIPSQMPSKWKIWNHLENSWRTPSACLIPLSQIWMRYLLQRRVPTLNKNSAPPARPNRMPRPADNLPSLQQRLYQSGIRSSPMHKRLLHWKAEYILFWSDRTSRWQIDNASKTKRRIRNVRKSSMRWKTQTKQQPPTPKHDCSYYWSCPSEMFQMQDRSKWKRGQLRMHLLQWNLLPNLSRLQQILWARRDGATSS